MKKLLSLFLALTMVLSCTALAAAPAEDLDPPLWQQWGYESYEDMMEYGIYTEQEYLDNISATKEYQAWVDAYKAAHPDEVAAFDADAWFEGLYSGDWDKKDFMELVGLDSEEAFQVWMMDSWLGSLYSKEQWEKEIAAYKAAHPEEIAAFDADVWFNENLAEMWGGGKAEYMAELSLATQEEFYNAMLLAYLQQQFSIQSYKDQWADIQTEEPERTALFLEEVDGWIADNYYYFNIKTFEEYLEYYSWYKCAEEAYIDLFYDWNAEYAAAQETMAQRNAFITERGGVPGALGVMLNGQFLAFPEGRAPYAKGGVTYADAATLSTALGMEVPAPIDGYVSVRSAAEAAGLKVWWDGDCQTAVLIDVKAAVAKIDADFTIFNSTLAKWKTDLTKNYKSGVSLKADVTMFDSLDGDKTAGITMSFSQLYSAKGLQMTGKYDAAKLLDMFTSALGENEYGPDAGTLDQIRGLLKGEFELRADYENAMAYLKSSLLDWLYRQDTTRDVPAGSWMSIPFDGLDFAALLNAPTPTYGGIVCSNIDTWSITTTPAYYYDILMDDNQGARALGDENFVKSGSDYTLTLDLDDYAALMGWESGEYWYDAPAKFDLTLTVRPDGSVSGKLLYQSSDGYSYYDEPATRVSADFNFSPATQRLTLEVHGKNTYKVVVTMNGTTSTTTQAPALTPPADANVVEY